MADVRDYFVKNNQEKLPTPASKSLTCPKCRAHTVMYAGFAKLRRWYTCEG